MACVFEIKNSIYIVCGSSIRIAKIIRVRAFIEEILMVFVIIEIKKIIILETETFIEF